MEEQQKKQPVHKIVRGSKGGQLQVTIWENATTTEKGLTFYNYSIQVSRSYTTDGTNFKDTNQFNREDMLPLSKMLWKADCWLDTNAKKARPAGEPPQ